MSYTALHNAIRKRFKEQVAGPESLPVAWDNAAPPATAGIALWARFSIRTGDTDAAELGGTPRYRTVGVAFAQLFAPTAKGDAGLLTLADTVVAAFRGVRADGVTYRSPSLTPVGRSDAWWQVNVELPFYYDD